MRIILTLFCLMFLTQVYGQTGSLFQGTLNKTVKVTLYLQGLDEGTNAERILGAYKYDTQTKYILLNGYRNNDGNIVLVEQSTANFSGTFLGTINNNYISGKWISANQKKSYPFKLGKIVATKEQLARFKNAITSKANEFSNY